MQRRFPEQKRPLRPTQSNSAKHCCIEDQQASYRYLRPSSPNSLNRSLFNSSHTHTRTQLSQAFGVGCLAAQGHLPVRSGCRPPAMAAKSNLQLSAQVLVSFSVELNYWCLKLGSLNFSCCSGIPVVADVHHTERQLARRLPQHLTGCHHMSAEQDTHYSGSMCIA